MMKTFEFWFDFGSPAAYLAFTQIPRLEAETGANAIFRPMLLGGVFQATGNQSPATVPAKGSYTFTDFDRFAKRYGVPFNQNPHFPINTLLLMRGAVGLQQQDDARFMAYCSAMFKAIWVESLNMNDPATVGTALHHAGFAPQALLTLANEPATKDALKSATQEAVKRGVFGAPTFFVGNQMFWGQDRLDFVKEALQ
ncbi:MAG: 2-hydroxychromene-2-carboxylate isomerase [Burkholderiaceae bacterium]|nr:2-hydroxychromene-2-carboxylate isomerase [Burkholderiaceae bacterium]